MEINEIIETTINEYFWKKKKKKEMEIPI